ncbi:EF-hand calcium-binding domain-containing protein 14 isoform X1 [Plodia interpunctella]|uniref:EF-hand calcium-binding domain-containing protein 14 isoform X1 n=1 Tax=Plodia interpunctella TaxID=58824 RepID=UPI002368DEBB|nr:EF-hand calcium-binding domain-containing protein 14 isoform X1 [Plodia interpunctella]XP_053614920.1 EF-hand calcium-binding domain-containing protein 14 isoform X1 [Plodia interpunctella]
MESAVHAAVPLRVGKKMRKRRELDALVGGAGSRGGRLLSASSDEGEPWGRRTSRRRRSRPFVRLAAALALCVCVVSAATVLWLFVDVRRQIVSLRNEMDRVSTSSEGVGDALQVCHTSSKVLKENVTDLSQRLIKLEQDHMELVKQVDLSKAELAAITDKLAAAPTLGQMPTRLAQLEKTVAHFGSQIQGFDSGINTARSQAATAAAGVDDIKALLDKLHAKNNETLASVSASRKDSEELRAQLAALNSTLAARVDALQSKVDELQKLSATAAPTPASTTTSSTTTTTTTTAPPPGPPAKPNVLQ